MKQAMTTKGKSLRQLAKELGVSASYLSQVKHGKRPASEKVLSSLGQSVKHSVVEEEQSSYNVNLLGISLAVGRLTLDQLGQVRILDPQPLRKLMAVVRMRELLAPAMPGF